MSALQFLITGTGRCGTGYMAKVLESVGVRCGHEDVFGLMGTQGARDVLKKGRWEADSSWLAAPFLGRALAWSPTVIHLVRDPKAVIDSWTRLGFFLGQYNEYSLWMDKHLPQAAKCWRDPTWKAAAAYIAWNAMIEPWANVRHRVEDDPATLLAQLGIPFEGKALFNDKDYNTRTHPTHIKADIKLHLLPEPLRRAILRMAGRYGYHTGEEKTT